MKTLNLDILINTPKETIKKDLNQIFINLLNEIQNYLDLAPINPNISIIIKNEQKEYSEDFFSLGVRRTIINDQTKIEISEKYVRFLEFILLREAYLIFIPYELREKQIIQIVIHEILESDLFKLKAMSEWKTLVRSDIINYDFLSSQYDKLDKFFNLEATESTQSPTQFFFEFIRRNITLIHDKMDDFYDILYEEFIYKTSKSLFNDEIVETIRVLVKIFYNVKLFRNYNEFEDFFQKFKENKIISTDLSKRKFNENLHWINKCTIISPSSHPIYSKIGINMVFSILKFNPILPRKDIYNILKRFPFIHRPIFTRYGFSEEIRCQFILSKKYLKDLLKFIDKLYEYGYILSKNCFIWTQHNNFLNMNYFREFYRKYQKIINPNHKYYDTRYELKFSKNYDESSKLIELNLLDWLIFERAGQFSVTGFGFERRDSVLQSLKDEILNHIESERNLISNFKASLNIFYNNKQLKKELFDFIENNKRFGFFYIAEMLESILFSLELVEKVINQNPHINSIFRLQEYLKSNQFSQMIEENITIKNKEIQSIVLKDIIPLHFKSAQSYKILRKKFENFNQFFRSCSKLKIFSLDSLKSIIENKQLTEKIYNAKDLKLKQSYEIFKPYKISYKTIDTIYKKFIENGLITPLLINTIITSSFAKYHPILLLKSTERVQKQLEKIIRFFPRIILERVEDLYNNNSFIIVFGYFLNIKEKKLLASILYNIFKEDLVSFKRYFTSGLSPFITIKNFYDFDKNEFFYTRDLFDQSFNYLKKTLGEIENPLQEIKTRNQKEFWSHEKSFLNLVNEVENRVSYKKPDLNINAIKELIIFNNNLIKNLLDPERFKKARQTNFFKNFIKSIKFIPFFQAFGLSQYYLYFRPSNLDKLDFKHLLANTFQSIKYPVIIDESNSFIIKYIFPNRNPNMKHLNWYTKTKHIISEYCLFSTKKVYQILNFNYNIGVSGWNYDSNRFKIYLQNILFNPDYEVEFPNMKYFVLDYKTEHFGPKSAYFKALYEIYNRKTIDLKSYLGTRKQLFINRITTLLKRSLIFPYIALKNLDFQDKFYLILPNIKKELNQILIKIFNFFNYGFIYEIEGKYYISGFNEEINFENGLMIKLYMPQCEADEFLKLFDLLFEHLQIDRYIVLTDLTNGKNLLKTIYGNLDFLDSYNPLINLKWDKKDKIWLNHKLYTDKFEKIYPDLFYGVNTFQSS